MRTPVDTEPDGMAQAINKRTEESKENPPAQKDEAELRRELERIEQVIREAEKSKRERELNNPEEASPEKVKKDETMSSDINN